MWEIVSKNNLSVYCLKYAESFLNENMIFNSGSHEKQIAISFAIYLIKTENKNILVDAGCDFMPGFVMKRFNSPTFVLRQVGLSADLITDVIITHAHHDHIEAVKHFENAVIHITKSEYENGKKYIPNNFDVITFEKEFLIESKIRIIECGGHSVGSAIVEIRTDDIIHILAGDECYTNDCITHKKTTGSYHNLEKSKKFIEKYSDKKYRVHTCHDVSLKTERII